MNSIQGVKKIPWEHMRRKKVIKYYYFYCFSVWPLVNRNSQSVLASEITALPFVLTISMIISVSLFPKSFNCTVAKKHSLTVKLQLEVIHHVPFEHLPYSFWQTFMFFSHFISLLSWNGRWSASSFRAQSNCCFRQERELWAEKEVICRAQWEHC